MTAPVLKNGVSGIDKKKATGFACGLVISKSLHARRPGLRQVAAASQECDDRFHSDQV
jgi:hypothetical protein